ncbi:hypothetical protein [Lactococcus lactis]|uniref:hypothetical protein n=1 Tax=Lactococcus lactis TaxID=1358 RepID=UPI003D2EDAE4
MKEIKLVQSDIDNFINDFREANTQEEELFRFLGKKIIFLKLLQNSLPTSTEYTYIRQLMSDLLYLVKSYKEDEIRYIYLNIRSVIEAFARLFNEVEYGTNRVTMTVLLENINKYIMVNSLKDKHGEIIDYSRLKSLYSESCLFVHGDSSNNNSLSEYYQSVLSPKIVKKEKNKICRTIIFLIDTLITISSYRFSNKINDYFVRKKDLLKLLVGNFNFEIIKNFSNLIISYNFNGQIILKEIITCKKGGNFPILNQIIEGYIIKSCTIPVSKEFDDWDINITCDLIEFVKETY